MAGLPSPRSRWLDRFALRRVEYRLALRVTVAAVLSFALAQYLGLGLPLWAVLTSLVVSQVSLGSSLKATIDYFIGTIGGVLYGGLIALLVPRPNELALLGVLAVAVAPLAMLAAVRPNLKAAPITAVIVLLVPEMHHTSTVSSIVDRVYEVGLGGIVGALVSVVLFPMSGFRLMRETAAGTLDQMALALDMLLSSVAQGFDVDALHRVQDGIGRGLTKLSAITAEAEHERTLQLATAPGTGPLLRTLLRLRHDLVMIGRAAADPLPIPLREPLLPPLDQVRQTAKAYLQACANALRAGARPPSCQAFTSALNAYSVATARLRREGATRGHPGDVTERFFALGFALEQLGQNSRDLERCIGEWATAPGSAPLGNDDA